MADLSEVIQEQLDAQTPDEPTPETPTTTDDVPEAPTPEPTAEVAPEAPVEATEPPPAPEPESYEVPSPAVKPQEEFEKKFGVASTSLSGRENRIPYSRVKKITEKAEREVAEVALGRKLADGEKAHDVVKAYVAQIPELTSKVKSYEDQIQKVADFEDMLFKRPDQFLQLLATVDAYKPFFKSVEEAFESRTNGTPQEAPAVDPTGDMPQPDQPLSDGTFVYSIDGLKALLNWQAKQVEDRVTKQVTERYKPIESEWQANQRIQAAIPQIQAQINEARTWPMFTENEEDIIKVIQGDQRISLEGAYRKVVFPKYEGKLKELSTERTKLREEILAEIKAAPRATSVSTPATKASPAPAGTRSLEEVIHDQIKDMK